MSTTPSSTRWQWPGGAKAALSLTYDDGAENNLDAAIPDLDAADLRGTFYIVPAYEEAQRRQDDWQEAQANGHEIGNHTWSHRCRADGYKTRPKWMKRCLEEMNADELLADIARSAEWLDTHLGEDPDRSFAYPCGHTAVANPPDHDGYRRAVAHSHRFARALKPERQPNQPADVDLLLITSNMLVDNSLQTCQQIVRQALAEGGWGTLCFHGIGGPPFTFDRDLHQHLIAWLQEQPLWIAPVRDIALYIEQHR